jgi:hypothetical protein
MGAVGIHDPEDGEYIGNAARVTVLLAFGSMPRNAAIWPVLSVEPTVESAAIARLSLSLSSAMKLTT